MNPPKNIKQGIDPEKNHARCNDAKKIVKTLNKYYTTYNNCGYQKK